MNPKDTAQFSAVYAEAALAYLETEVPQAVLWLEDEGRWDFITTEEEVNPDDVAFILQDGWDGQLTLEHATDPASDDYDAFALRDEIEEQMEEEGVSRALIEALIDRRENLGDEEDKSLPDPLDEE